MPYVIFDCKKVQSSVLFSPVNSFAPVRNSKLLEDVRDSLAVRDGVDMKAYGRTSRLHAAFATSNLR